MLLQLHWQYRDGRPNELIAQSEIDTSQNDAYAKVRKFTEETTQNLVRPADARLLMVTEDSPLFFWAAETQGRG